MQDFEVYSKVLLGKKIYKLKKSHQGVKKCYWKYYISKDSIIISTLLLFWF
jgi:hypothetical protein